MYNGIVLIDKPAGMTSFDVVSKMRQVFHQKQVGHTGTLDPSVTGLLVIVLGKATKLIDFLQQSEKQYHADMILGIKTDTQDLDGQIIETLPIKKPISELKLQQTLTTFLGQNLQVPPMYSAIKVNGKRLYDLARKGQTVERKARSITISQLDQIGASHFDQGAGRQYLSFTATVSKGTYIRTLVEDIGASMAVPAVMKKLRRLAADGYRVDQAVPLEELLKNPSPDQFVIPLEKLLKQLPMVAIKQADWQLVQHGAWLRDLETDAPLVRIFYDQSMQAIYKKDQGLYRPEKMLLHESH
ncbi:tRNA pseudouridine(55) synthase TruB [Oenococcus sp.]|uniref:tRNA pseudouridine(55) synthase TruB n=1 Tax=Oenococcus sp. TaxID=1979414 RepID=UPI0039E9B055